MNEDDSHIGLNDKQLFLLKQALEQERTQWQSENIYRSCVVGHILAAINLGITRNLDDKATEVLVEIMLNTFPQSQ